MIEFKILVQGYVYKKDKALFASPTTTLIKENGLKILVDPGANKDKLLEALSLEGLKPEDIDMIFLTHYHLDHTINIRLFPGKDILD